MNRKTLTCGVAAAAMLAAAPQLDRPISQAIGTVLIGQAQAADVTINVFFEPLASHGRWLETERYGYVWVPARVDRKWRPYTEGHWEYTKRYGWVWVSEEPWGWATYHYGRWSYDDGYGWYWVPGNKWAPAWVSWHRSDDYIGWAPLPPSGSGYAFSASIGNAAIGVGAWRFVAARDFLARDLGRRIVVVDRNDEIYRRTRPAGVVQIQNNVVVNNVINVQTIERVTKQKVVVREVRDAQQRQDIQADGNALVAYRPQIANRKPEAKPKDAVEAKDIRNRVAQVKSNAPAQGQGKASAAGASSDGARPDSRAVKGAAPAAPLGQADAPAKDGKDTKDSKAAQSDPASGKARNTSKSDGAPAKDSKRAKSDENSADRGKAGKAPAAPAATSAGKDDDAPRGKATKGSEASKGGKGAAARTSNPAEKDHAAPKAKTPPKSSARDDRPEPPLKAQGRKSGANGDGGPQRAAQRGNSKAGGEPKSGPPAAKVRPPQAKGKAPSPDGPASGPGGGGRPGGPPGKKDD